MEVEVLVLRSITGTKDLLIAVVSGENGGYLYINGMFIGVIPESYC